MLSMFRRESNWRSRSVSQDTHDTHDLVMVRSKFEMKLAMKNVVWGYPPFMETPYIYIYIHIIDDDDDDDDAADDDDDDGGEYHHRQHV